MSSLLGRADLLRALAAGLPVEEAARLLGATRQAPMSSEIRTGESAENVPAMNSASSLPVAPPSPDLEPVVFLRARKRSAIATIDPGVIPGESAPTATAEDLATLPPPPPPRPLQTRAQRRRVLERLLRQPETSSALDWARLAERVARKDPIVRLPRLRRRRWPHRVVVAVGFGLREAPLHSELVPLLRELRRMVSGEVVPLEVEDPNRLHGVLPESHHALLLGPVSWSSDHPEALVWWRARRRLEHDGVRTSALVIESGYSSLDRAAEGPWEKARRGSAGFLSAADLHGLFLDLLSLAAFVELGWLRRVRDELASLGASLATELGAWSALPHRTLLHGYFGAKERSDRHASLRNRLVQDQPYGVRVVFVRVARTLQQWRSQSSPAAWHEEVCAIQEIARGLDLPLNFDSDLETAADVYRRYAGSIRDETQLSLDARRALARYVSTASARFPSAWLADEGHGAPFAAAWAAAQTLLRGSPSAGAARGAMVREGTQIRLVEGPDGRGRSGSVVLPAWEIGPSATKLAAGGLSGPITLSILNPVEWNADSQATVTVVSSSERATVESFTKPRWAAEVGCDEEGVYVEVGEAFERLRFRWVLPAPPRDREAPTHGDWQIVSSTLPKWAARAGIEEPYGAWVEIEVRGVSQRLRWIEPGRFLMGSPPTEVGRFEDEAPHEVTLAHGFWLATTPCTNAFWKAVMGTVPSRFPGDRNPVENVSFLDVQVMFLRLEEVLPGLLLRLPTEAEWEFACRSGTSTATYVGDLKHTERDSLLDRIAWYGANSGGTTHVVGAKEPNTWGLWDMLGSVWEWCADEAEIEDGIVTSKPGGARRILRGGSWDVLARSCRAAFRFAGSPGYRYGYVGFRLARGQGFVSSQAETKQAKGRKPPRGKKGK